MPNRQCNLECVKDGKQASKGDDVVEFIGPVKIILVDQPKDAYRNKIWNAAFVVLAQMLMSTTFLIVTFYSLTYKKKKCLQALHVFLCTIGLHLFLPMGILTLNNLNGAAAPMKLSDRKFEHGIMQIFGLGSTIAGSIISFFSGYPTIITVHSCLGIATNCLALLNGIVGIVIYIFCKKISKNDIHKFNDILFSIHYILGIFTISLSSICFLYGITKKSFTEWLPLDEIYYCLGIFCVYYTCVVIYKPLYGMNSLLSQK